MVHVYYLTVAHSKVTEDPRYVVEFVPGKGQNQFGFGARSVVCKFNLINVVCCRVNLSYLAFDSIRYIVYTRTFMPAPLAVIQF